MRLGLVGPAEGDVEGLRDAVEFLLGDADVDEALYLGPDEEVLEFVVEGWAREIAGGDPVEATFLDRAFEIAREGTPEAIETLLERDALLRRLATVRKLPPPPTRAVELLADRVLLAVHDKSILDEEDIANAQLIAYGLAPEASLRRFGKRSFLTPGPVRSGRVLVLELEEAGTLSVGLFETTGVPVWRETLARRTSKVNVSR